MDEAYSSVGWLFALIVVAVAVMLIVVPVFDVTISGLLDLVSLLSSL